MNALESLESCLQQQLGAVVIGMRPIVRALAIAIVARGHVLLQGAPGLGKTLLSKTLAAALGGQFKRVQGTSDLMPSDITGVHIYDQETRDFVFRPGPVFADVLLVDEVNRAGPKTQSALLEAMEERQVTVDRKNYPLPDDFIVIATQNPREFEGTFPLPESQLDRFMLRIDIAYPARESELTILAQYGNVDAHAGKRIEPPIGAEALAAARAAVGEVHVAPELSAYIADLAAASRTHSGHARAVYARRTRTAARRTHRRRHAWSAVRGARRREGNGADRDSTPPRARARSITRRCYGACGDTAFAGADAGT